MEEANLSPNITASIRSNNRIVPLTPKVVALVLLAFTVLMLALLLPSTARGATVVYISSDCLVASDLGIVSDEPLVCGIKYGETRKILRSEMDRITAQKNIVYKSDNIITVIRDGYKVGEDEVARAVVAYYGEYFPSYNVSVERINIRQPIYIGNSYGVSATLTSASPLGNTVFQLQSGGENVAKVNVYVRGYQEGYVSSMPISRGEAFRGRVSRKSVDITFLKGDLATNIDKFVATKYIGKGKPILEEHLTRAPSAKKGSVVPVKYSSGAITVESNGQLVEDAYIGEPVSVKNLDTNKTITGIYDASGTVLIGTP